jgi:NitT/TauT family transport system permease protein
MAEILPLGPPMRPEFECAELEVVEATQTIRYLPVLERLSNVEWLRRGVILIALAIVWELYARYIDNALMFPTFSDTVAALWDALVHGRLLDRIWTSITILAVGYAAGVVLAAALTTLAVSTRIGTDLLLMLTGMFNPLPAIALLPLAMLWFGLGVPSLIFVLVHSVMWSVALNMYAGFTSVSDTQRMAGMNYGLRGIRYVFKVLIPASLPSILAGMKIGWAFAWRTLIAAELVFGVSSRSGGLGWFIFENRNDLATAYVFAGLMCVILIGLLVENLVFRTIEMKTVRRWGMQR